MVCSVPRSSFQRSRARNSISPANVLLIARQRRRRARLGSARVAVRASAAEDRLPHVRAADRCSTTAATWDFRSPCSRSGRRDSRRWSRCSRSRTCCISRSACGSSTIMRSSAAAAESDGRSDRARLSLRGAHPPMPEWADFGIKMIGDAMIPADADLARRAPVRGALGRLAHRRDRRHRVPA